MNSLRQLLISMMNLLLVLIVGGTTLVGFLGAGYANPWQGFSFGMALVGAVVGFLGGALGSGMLALLLDMHDLLKKIEATGRS